PPDVLGEPVARRRNSPRLAVPLEGAGFQDVKCARLPTDPHGPQECARVVGLKRRQNLVDLQVRDAQPLCLGARGAFEAERGRKGRKKKVTSTQFVHRSSDGIGNLWSLRRENRSCNNDAILYPRL